MEGKRYAEFLKQLEQIPKIFNFLFHVIFEEPVKELFESVQRKFLDKILDETGNVKTQIFEDLEYPDDDLNLIEYCYVDHRTECLGRINDGSTNQVVEYFCQGCSEYSGCRSEQQKEQ